MHQAFPRIPAGSRIATAVFEVEDKGGMARQFGVMYIATTEARTEHEVDEQAAAAGRPARYREVLRRHVKAEVLQVYLDGIEVTPILHPGILQRLETAAKLRERQIADVRDAEAA